MICFLYVLFLFCFQVKILHLPFIINNLFPVAIMRVAMCFFREGSGSVSELFSGQNLFMICPVFPNVMSVLIFYPLSIFWKKRIVTRQFCVAVLLFHYFTTVPLMRKKINSNLFSMCQFHIGNIPLMQTVKFIK